MKGKPLTVRRLSAIVDANGIPLVIAVPSKQAAEQLAAGLREWYGDRFKFRVVETIYSR